MINEITIKRYDSDGAREQVDLVIREHRANLVINGELYLSMMCMPQNL